MPRGAAPGERRGGREKGSKNKRTLATDRAVEEARAKIAEAIPQAFEGDAHALLMAVYKDPEQPISVRIDAAGRAISFEKPRLQSTSVGGGPDGKGPVALEISWKEPTE